MRSCSWSDPGAEGRPAQVLPAHRIGVPDHPEFGSRSASQRRLEEATALPVPERHRCLLFSSTGREHLISCNQWGTRRLKRWTVCDMMVLISKLLFKGSALDEQPIPDHNYVPPTGQMTRPCTIGSNYLAHHEDAEYRYYYTNAWPLRSSKVQIYFKTVSWHYIKSCLRMTEGLHIKRSDVCFSSDSDLCLILLRLHR